MKIVLVLMLGMGLQAATLCTPDVVHDSRNLSHTCPQLGAPIIAAPNAQYAWGANDNLPDIDFDFNDVYGTAIFNADASAATVTLYGSLSAWTVQDDIGAAFNDVTLNEAHGPWTGVAFPVDGELILTLDGPDGLFYSGDDARNVDELPHFWVQRYDNPAETPEPGNLLIAASGLLFAWGWRKRLG